MITTAYALEVATALDVPEVRHVIEQLLADRQAMRECMTDDIAMLQQVAESKVYPPDCAYVAGLHAKVLERIGK